MRALILSNDEVRQALKPADCVQAMADVLVARAKNQAYMPLRSIAGAPGAPGFIGLMPAYSGVSGAYALKAICLMPSNPQRGLDTHQGTVTLFHPETGVPTAVLNASAVTEIRTAAVTAVATNTLARHDAKVLAIIGAGVQARSHLEALALVRDFEEVRVYAPTAGHVHKLIDERPPGTPEPLAAASGREAIEGADVIVTATSSKEPVLNSDWLGPGAHVNAVGASMPAAREIDVATVAAAALFCDSRESLENEAGEFILAVEQGAIDPTTHVRGELGEVLASQRPGRIDDRELTLFRSLGIGVEDLAAAELAVATARRLGIGTEVEL
jgi:ornithine cyclodeaminase